MLNVKSIWEDYIKPFLIYLVISFAFFCIGFFTGYSRGVSDIRLTDSGATELGSLDDAERQRIAELEETVRSFEAGNRELRESINRTIEHYNSIDKTVGRLQEVQGNMVEKLRRIIEAVEGLQETLRNHRDYLLGLRELTNRLDSVHSD